MLTNSSCHRTITFCSLCYCARTRVHDDKTGGEETTTIAAFCNTVEDGHVRATRERPSATSIHTEVKKKQLDPSGRTIVLSWNSSELREHNSARNNNGGSTAPTSFKRCCHSLIFAQLQVLRVEASAFERSSALNLNDQWTRYQSVGCS